MTFSTSEINELECFYRVSLPKKYKAMLLLIGDKIIDISLKDPRNKSFTGDFFNSSIYDIQDDMQNMVRDHDIDELLNPSIFFLTAFLHCDDCEYVSYFIKTEEPEDSSVYSWRKDTALDTYSIKKFSNNIEEWLCKVNPILYLELQTRKLLSDVL